jgi:hypothetical protein
MSVNKLLGEVNGFDKNLMQQSRPIIKRWEKTGLLEGLSSSREKTSMAVLLENQAKQLIHEATRTGTAAGSEEWSGVALPLVRRVFAEIAAKEFVSVQPMTLPSGLVFYLDFKYGTAQPGFQTGQGKDSQRDSVFGVTGEEARNSDPFGGLYGAGRFGYSLNDRQSTPLTRTTSVGGTTFATGSVGYNSTSVFQHDTEFQAQYSSSLAAGNIFTVTVSSASIASFDKEGIRAFRITGSNILGYFPQYTTVNSNASQVTFVVSASAVPATASVDFHIETTPITRGDFEGIAGGPDVGIPEINLEIRQDPIVAKTRKLKANWTPEQTQDLNAYHNIDAEAELTSMLSEQISQEIDLEILDMLIRNAQITERWSARLGRMYDQASAQFTDMSTNQSNASAYNQQSWFQTLGTKIQKVSNSIHQKTLRGGANFLVCSPQVATIIESIPGYSGDGEGSRFSFGVHKAGSINGRITIYKNPYMTENQILIGFRGNSFLETGAVYAPYVPLVMTPLIYDPVNLTPIKGIATRYAKKVVRGEFYGLIQVDSLGDI